MYYNSSMYERMNECSEHVRKNVEMIENNDRVKQCWEKNKEKSYRTFRIILIYLNPHESLMYRGLVELTSESCVSG